MSEAKARILCVEDNRDSREMIATLLRQSNQNYQVTAVETAAEALALNGREKFDLYILDIWLPGMDGVELCRRLRERGITEPIMFFSAMGVQQKDKDYVLASGANEFLVKSVDIDRFTETVEKLLSGGSSPVA
ncbi:MAG TPA: response regulator [Pyrinomonadaceae bacterium]|nr:response regulator [Pyrinomonadaceae bacterium]